MKTDVKYYFWNKGEVYQLNKYFKTSEFSCQCKYPDCKEQKVSKDLIEKLTKLREDVNEPLIITSGFRCEKHQADIRNSGVSTVVAKKSTHELGEAVDVKPSRMKLEFFNQIAKKYFKAIGIANNFTHLDTRSEKQREWKY